MRTVADILTKAAELIRLGHSRHELATDGFGRPRWPEDPDAVAWCPVGAIIRAVADLTGDPEGGHEEVAAAVNRLLTVAGFRGMRSLVVWNSAATATEAADLLTRAAETAP